MRLLNLKLVTIHSRGVSYRKHLLDVISRSYIVCKYPCAHFSKLIASFIHCLKRSFFLLLFQVHFFWVIFCTCRPLVLLPGFLPGYYTKGDLYEYMLFYLFIYFTTSLPDQIPLESSVTILHNTLQLFAGA